MSKTFRHKEHVLLDRIQLALINLSVRCGIPSEIYDDIQHLATQDRHEFCLRIGWQLKMETADNSFF